MCTTFVGSRIPGHHCPDQFAVLEDCDLFCDIEDLDQAVGNKNDCHPACFEFPDQVMSGFFTSVEVREAVGSSMIRTLESKEMALAISTICCSATDRELHMAVGLII